VLFKGCQNYGIMPGNNNSQQQQKQSQWKKILRTNIRTIRLFLSQKKSGHWRTNPSEQLQYFKLIKLP
jgi:hypothetical protein